MEAVGLLGLLGVCSFEDIRKKQVHVISIFAFGILGVFLHMIYQKIDLKDMLGGMCIGVLLYVISIASKERIGKGDALIVMVSGIYLGFWENIFMLWMASLMAGVTGIALYITGKKNISIPFVPFLLVGYVLYLVISYINGGTNVS